MSVVSERTSYSTANNRRRSLSRAYRPGGASCNRTVIGGGDNVDQHFLLPHFSAAANEGPTKMDVAENWAENTTVLTSEHSWHAQQSDLPPQPAFPPPSGQSLPRLALRRCSRLLWLCAAFLLSFSALVSAPLMASLPHALTHLGLLGDDAQWARESCEADCQGQLLNLGAKTVLLLLALFVLFWRRAPADMPRLFVHRAAFAFFVFFVLFAFWLFYVVRVLLESSARLAQVLSLALSLLDLLLFIHCIWIFFELRQFRPTFCVQIVRDPDGECLSHQLGQMSVQEAAVSVFHFYRSHFPPFNAALDQSRRSSTAGGRFRSVVPAPTGFKLYDIDGPGEGAAAALTELNARILLAASQRRMAGHNELFYEECEWEKRFRKRKCRLIACAEEMFAQVQSVEGGLCARRRDRQQGGPQQQQMVEPMDAQTAARTLLSAVGKQLHRFLRFTRQDRLHPHSEVLAHLQRCLALGLSSRTFLQRFFSGRPPLLADPLESKWSIVCDCCPVSAPLRHGLSFVLRCHDQDGLERGVQLLCTVSAFPFLNLTEQGSPGKNQGFQLKVLPGNVADLTV